MSSPSIVRHAKGSIDSSYPALLGTRTAYLRAMPWPDARTIPRISASATGGVRYRMMTAFKVFGGSYDERMVPRGGVSQFHAVNEIGSGGTQESSHGFLRFSVPESHQMLCIGEFRAFTVPVQSGFRIIKEERMVAADRLRHS